MGRDGQTCLPNGHYSNRTHKRFTLAGFGPGSTGRQITLHWFEKLLVAVKMHSPALSRL